MQQYITMIFRLHNSHKLMTKEDPYHMHKTVGFICLLNYAYRYYLLIRYGSMYLDNHRAAILVVYHVILSGSSLVFHIPANRNKSAPMIYPEYRLHSILFAFRSAVCYFLTWFESPIEYKFAVCYLTMILADTVSAIYQTPDKLNTTMRNMPFDSRIREEDQRQITMMQSSQQIGATLYMFGNLDSCFSPMFAIQIAAFLMTMVRKNIIDSNTWHIVYNIALWINGMCFYSLPMGFIFADVVLFNVFYYWRFAAIKNRPRNIIGNKYIGWTIVFAVLYVYQSSALYEKIDKLSNNSVVIRRIMILIYLITQMRRSKGLLVAFCPKTE